MNVRFLLILAILAAGCVTPEPAVNETMGSPTNITNTSNETMEPPQPSTNDSVEVKTPNQDLVELVIASYNESEKGSYSNVNDLLEVEVEDVLPLLEGNDSVRHWTGLYVLSNIAYKAENKSEVKEKLKPFLDGNQSSFKFMAGVTLVTMGETDGLPVLIECLEYEEILFLSEPQIPVCEYSNIMLMRYTGQDYGYGCMPGYKDEDAIQKWEAWWHQSKDSVYWDEQSLMMVVQ